MFLTCLMLSWTLNPTLWFDRERSFYQTLEVERYQLQVSVFDDRGNPVKGLDKSDFEVFIDGQQEPIELVQYINLKRFKATNPESMRHRRLFVWIFDLKFTSERGVLEARRSAMNFVREDLRPNDLVAMFIVEPQRGFRLISNFTGEKSHLLTALSDLGLGDKSSGRLGVGGYFNAGAVNDDLTDLHSTGELIGLETAADNHLETQGNGNDTARETLSNEATETLQSLLDMGERQRRRGDASSTANYLHSLADLAKALSQVNGQKNIVLFSSGIDSSFLGGADHRQMMVDNERLILGESWQVDSDLMGSGSIASGMEDVIVKLRESGAVVYAIDTGSLGRDRRRGRENHGLNMLAADTGGLVFLNQNRYLDPLRRISRAASSYYVLTLAPEEEWDQVNSLPIKVRVKYKRRTNVVAGSRLHLRRKFEELTQLERQMHLSEFIGKEVTAYEIPVRVNQITMPEGNGLVRLLVELEIGGQYFENVDKRDDTRDIEFFVRAYDEQRRVTYDTVSSTYRLNFDSAGSVIQQTGVKYFASLLVRPGKFKLSMVVRDLESGRVGSLMRWVDVPELLPPAIATLLANNPWVTLHGMRDLPYMNLDLTYPLRMNDQIFIPDTMRKVLPTEKAHFFFLVNADKDEQLTEGRVRVDIRDHQGRTWPVPATALSVDYGGREVDSFLPVLLRLDMSQLNLSPGDYSMLTEFRQIGAEPIRTVTNFSM